MKVFSQSYENELAFNMPFHSYMKSINHRGYSNVAPENTLPAYILSAQKGYKYVETDVSFTSDGVPVLLHDATVDRTSNGTGNIGSLTYEAVRSLDFGSWKSETYSGTQIPSLEEFIALCRDLGLHPYIELKNNATYTTAQIHSIVDIVRGYGMIHDVTFISFSATYLGYVKDYDATLRLGYVMGAVTAEKITTALTLKTDYNEVFIDANAATDDYVALCKEAGLPMEIWTSGINFETKAQISAINSYVSGVTSNNGIAEFVKYEKAMS